MNRFREDAIRDFYNPEFRHEYTDEFLQIRVASQIRAIREQRGWTQNQLAEESGMKQSRISAMENVNYSSWSIRTLRRLAKAFDVALNVEFKTFGERLVDDMIPFSREHLEKVAFAEDPIFQSEVELPPKLTQDTIITPLAGVLAMSGAAPALDLAIFPRAGAQGSSGLLAEWPTVIHRDLRPENVLSPNTTRTSMETARLDRAAA
jgi:transcriptional regulator with XRE-family HTH domain